MSVKGEDAKPQGKGPSGFDQAFTKLCKRFNVYFKDTKMAKKLEKLMMSKVGFSDYYDCTPEEALTKDWKDTSEKKRWRLYERLTYLGYKGINSRFWDTLLCEYEDKLSERLNDLEEVRKDQEEVRKARSDVHKAPIDLLENYIQKLKPVISAIENIVKLGYFVDDCEFDKETGSINADVMCSCNPANEQTAPCQRDLEKIVWEMEWLFDKIKDDKEEDEKKINQHKFSVDRHKVNIVRLNKQSKANEKDYKKLTKIGPQKKTVVTSNQIKSTSQVDTTSVPHANLEDSEAAAENVSNLSEEVENAQKDEEENIVNTTETLEEEYAQKASNDDVTNAPEKLVEGNNTQANEEEEEECEDIDSDEDSDNDSDEDSDNPAEVENAENTKNDVTAEEITEKRGLVAQASRKKNETPPEDRLHVEEESDEEYGDNDDGDNDDGDDDDGDNDDSEDEYGDIGRRHSTDDDGIVEDLRASQYGSEEQLMRQPSNTIPTSTNDDKSKEFVVPAVKPVDTEDDNLYTDTQINEPQS